MDFSSLTEAQQQQMQQLQTQYQEHQAQRQHAQAESISSAAAAAAPAAQQYQDYPSQQLAQAAYDSQSQALYSYDPSQAQSSYDPSPSYYSSYYHQYQDPQQQQSYQHAPQYASYYNGSTNVDYSNAYQQQQQQYSQPDTTPYYPPAVPVSREGPPPQTQATDHRLGEETQHQQNAYNPPHNNNNSNASSFNNQVGSASVPGGLNAAAAAVAALSQLTQYAGNMEAVERAQGGRQWYDNGGGGYGQPMGPGHFMGHMGHPVGRSPHRGGGRRGGFRGGRGNFGNHPPNTGGYGPPFRGRGRGRGRSGHHYQPHGAPSSSLVEASAAEEAEEPAAANNNEAQADVRNQKSIRITWCELCRVDCTNLEILEQHKNGKRHKKNLQRLEEVKSSSEASAVMQVNEKITSGTGAEVPENAQQDGQKPENVPTDVGIDENKAENELDDDEEKNPWRQGMKRKMRGGRGGKRAKTFGGPSRRALGPPKPKVVIPLICDLCNVKCDTQEVFDRHVAGKKHMAKLKRFEGHQAMYGPTGVQALYPPNPIAQALFRPQGPQQAIYGPPQGSYPPPGDCIPPQAQNPNPQLSDAPLEFGNQNNVPEAQQPSVAVEPETKQVTT